MVPNDDLEAILARVVQDFLDAQLQGRDPDIEEMVRAHPELDQQIRQRIKSLREVDDLFAGLVQETDDPALTPSDHDLIGKRLGDFEILSLIGRGGMGAVFLARQVPLGREVALKVIADVAGEQSRTLERFKREARVLAQLSHPHIVPIHDTGQEGPYTYFAMEYIRGVSLDAVLTAVRHADASKKASEVLREQLQRTKANGTQPPEPTIHEASGSQIDRDYILAISNIIMDVGSALQCAHEQGILHRDVKPSNILIDAAGTAKLVDFGLARAQSHPSLTVTGEFFGTPNYVSPEQIHNPDSVDRRADVYSLAATYYECLTLRRPFEGDTVNETLTNVLSREVIPPRRHSPRLAPDINTVVLHALEKEPQDRYQNAADFAADIGNVLAFRPIKAKPPTFACRMLRVTRGNTVRILSITAAVMIILVSSIAMLRISKDRAHAEAVKLYQTGLAKKTTANHTEAIEYFAGAIARDPRYVEAYLAAAECHRLLGNHDQAVILSKKALEIDSNSLIALYELGLAMIAARDWDQAQIALSRAVSLQPKFALGHATLAACYSALKRDDLAVKEFRHALELEPNSPQNGKILIVMGSLLASLNRELEAIAAYRRALELDPRCIDAHWGLGLSHTRMGNLAEAEQAFKKAVACAPNNPTGHEKLGWFYKWTDRPLDATLAYLHAGRACEQQDRPQQALVYYTECLAIDPNNATVLSQCAKSYTDLARYAEAVDFYKRALKAWPHDSTVPGGSVSVDFRADWHARMGGCYTQLKLPQEAEASYLRAIAMKPDLYTAYVGLAWIYQGCQRYQQAIDCWVRALQIDPTRDHYLHDALGCCHYHLQQYDKAIESFRVYLSATPNDLLTWSFLASAYSQRGDFQKAIECQNRAVAISSDTDQNTPGLKTILACYQAGVPFKIASPNPNPISPPIDNEPSKAASNSPP